MGRDRQELPKIQVTFFDSKRAVVGIKVLGPWYGSSDWVEVKSRIRVPLKSQLAVITVSMYGATGEMAIDNMVIQPISRKRPGKGKGER